MSKIIQIKIENSNYDLGYVQIPSNSSALKAVDTIISTAKQMDKDKKYNHLSHDEFKKELMNKLSTLFNFKSVEVYTANV